MRDARAVFELSASSNEAWLFGFSDRVSPLEEKPEAVATFYPEDWAKPEAEAHS